MANNHGWRAIRWHNVWESVLSMALSCSNVTYQAILTWHFSCLSVLLPPFSSLAIPHLKICCCCSVTVMSDSLTPWTAARQASLSSTTSWSFHKLMSIESVIPSDHLILCRPSSSCSQPFSASGSFPVNQFFTSGSPSNGVSASASVLPVNTQDWFPCSPRESQESSPTPQFKSINSSVLSSFYSPTLTSIHDYWKNHR